MNVPCELIFYSEKVLKYRTVSCWFHVHIQQEPAKYCGVLRFHLNVWRNYLAIGSGVQRGIELKWCCYMNHQVGDRDNLKCFLCQAF